MRTRFVHLNIRIILHDRLDLLGVDIHALIAARIIVDHDAVLDNFFRHLYLVVIRNMIPHRNLRIAKSDQFFFLMHVRIFLKVNFLFPHNLYPFPCTGARGISALPASTTLAWLKKSANVCALRFDI